MTDKKNTSGSPSAHPDDNNGRHLERVVDELRMVLSDLGRASQHNENLDEVINDKKEPPILPPDRTLSAPDPIDFEPLKPPTSPNPVSSDADFWNGNVLGWPANGESDIPDLPNGDAATPFTDPLGALSETEEPENFANGFDNLKESDLSLGEPEAVNMEDSEPPVPKESIDIRASAYGPLEGDDPGGWSAEEPLASLPSLPESPLSPLEREKSPSAPVTADSPEPAMAANPFAPAFDAFVEEKSLSTPPPAEAPAPEPAAVPIPQTIHKKPDPPKPTDPHLNLEAPDLKPKGLVQIACVFPEGQEKPGQSFVSKLKELAEKAKKPLNIQAVFVHPWTSDKIDVAAWKKSAVLSGADIMFVLVSKGNVGSLKTLNTDPMSEIKCRIVYVEQIPMRTLYADILVELQREK